MCAFNLSIKLRPIPFAPCSLDLTKTPPGQAVSLPSTSSILVTESNIFAPSSSLSGCRFGRSGSSGFVGGFRRRPVRGGSGCRCSRSNRSCRGRF